MRKKKEIEIEIGIERRETRKERREKRSREERRDREKRSREEIERRGVQTRSVAFLDCCSRNDRRNRRIAWKDANV